MTTVSWTDVSLLRQNALTVAPSVSTVTFAAQTNVTTTSNPIYLTSGGTGDIALTSGSFKYTIFKRVDDSVAAVTISIKLQFGTAATNLGSTTGVVIPIPEPLRPYLSGYLLGYSTSKLGLVGTVGNNLITILALDGSAPVGANKAIDFSGTYVVG